MTDPAAASPAGPPPRVFITGASSGIGAALARHYASRGALLGLVARRGDRLEALVRELGGARFSYPADVSDADALAAAAQDFMSRSGAPDIVIANAGISVGTLTEHAADLAAFERVFAINVAGMFATFAPLSPRCAPRVAAGWSALPRLPAFAACPAQAPTAPRRLRRSPTSSLRVELRGSGVQVVTLCPGYIETPMTAVNPYRMPFILPADEAARRLARAIDAGRSYAVVPWQMAIVAKLLRMLPNPLFDLLFWRAGRKPRGLQV